MGEIFRSQEMNLVQLFIQMEAVHDTVDELGELGVIQFRDLNEDVNAFQRHFVNEVKRSDELERKLRYFENELEALNVPLLLDDEALVHTSPSVAPLDYLEARTTELEIELRQMGEGQDALDKNHQDLCELKVVLTGAATFLESGHYNMPPPNGGARQQGHHQQFEDIDEFDVELQVMAPSSQDDERASFSRSGILRMVCGVVEREKVAQFERVLWRATKGNLHMRYEDCDPVASRHISATPISKEQQTVFMIFSHGERTNEKIKRICQSFGARIYPCPDREHERIDLLAQLEARLQDLESVLVRTRDLRKQILDEVAQNLPAWKNRVMKEKGIYHVMNMFDYDVGRKCLIAEGWCPKLSTEAAQMALRRGTARSGAVVPSILTVITTTAQPPTYFPLNKFTSPFQGIVESYGIAYYREINPATFTIVTFPFLFGVMFGDLGHGFMLFLFALYLVLNEKALGKQELDDMLERLYGGRYILLLMGIGSMWMGFLYNECFGLPMNWFGSSWKEKDGEMVFSGTPYPVGVDFMWGIASNDLFYYNSLKMKMSILLGVGQMTFGIFLAIRNAKFFKKPYDFYYESLPQIVFLLSIFGYMCLVIVIKWLLPWGSHDYKKIQPPSLLTLMIDMCLSPFQVNEHLYTGQAIVQPILLLIAIVCVPLMWFPKPFLLKRDHERGQSAAAGPRPARGFEVLEEDDEESGHGGGGHGSDEEEFDFGEIFIHQTIHTIEFVLGCISNTASYLRLWALSLAHSELSKVFYDQVFLRSLDIGNPIGIFIAFAIWATLTVGVLLGMECLSAFLHALRLHWVEFQNKFYKTDGIPFRAFSFEQILKGEDVFSEE
eukprot:TRINITY_DN5113_c0_g1_i1.p1 TRINITY_DN5113_c0_g1~~TRINITY_DN5113_c0_g1_i1.p1  ORF type:complete len:959 (-),score=225.36 TRINITY_DN5113_c0_g1_i1:9-2522(-)